MKTWTFLEFSKKVEVISKANDKNFPVEIKTETNNIFVSISIFKYKTCCKLRIKQLSTRYFNKTVVCDHVINLKTIQKNIKINVKI